ncbi:YueI family protein [Alteribacillus sp. HJP-4]|uniref:YueI family protein n=1 Tax=Alteribacillus sp. HJP-4 TaxID=2775394 RepID=UPI0035CCF4BF
MSGKNVNDYLEEGIYGKKETRPDEKQRFLGTYRERVIIALTKKQVLEKGIYPEVEEAMKAHPGATLLINGKLAYATLSPYTKLASHHSIHARRVSNMNRKTDIGLVLDAGRAVEHKEIFVEKKEPEDSAEGEKPWWKKLLGI